MEATDLRLEGVDLPPCTTRSCAQSLEVVPLGRTLRTLNGELHFISAFCEGSTQGQLKYKSTVEGEDRTSLPLEQLSQGMRLKVHCIARLSQSSKGGDDLVQLKRPFVPGSLRCINWSGEEVPVEVDRQTLLFEDEKEVFISYCPILEMRLTTIRTEINEWSGKVEWRLDLEEV
ncbi:MAG: hypothetical protein GY915_08615 [bacterium]|nr:hypothetical protein [bacterium]